MYRKPVCEFPFSLPPVLGFRPLSDSDRPRIKTGLGFRPPSDSDRSRIHTALRFRTRDVKPFRVLRLFVPRPRTLTAK